MLDGDSDDDSDGMADTWERGIGFDPIDPADATADPDGDGRPSLNEYLAGTDPRDPVSRFVITAVSRETSGLGLTWRSVPGRQYRFLGSDDLLTWHTLTQGGQPVVIDASATGDFTHFEIPISGDPPAARCFYRIEAVSP